MKLLVVFFIFAFAEANAYSYRIVGGEEATPHSYPHQVALFIDDFPFCGGSIIDDQLIATAAHCIINLRVIARVSKKVVGRVSIKVVVGAHNINENEPSQQVFKNLNAIVHKFWFPILLKNDIALVKLDQRIQLNEFAKIVNLPTRGADITGQLATVSGWGLTQGKGSASPTLKFAQSTVMANKECNKWYLGMIGDGQMCLSGKSPCWGMSGDPLIVRAESGDTQHGIASFGIIGFPSVFTRIEKYIDWIATNTA